MPHDYGVQRTRTAPSASARKSSSALRGPVPLRRALSGEGRSRVRQRSHVYEFRVTLAEVSPSIWRSIQVPEPYSFWDLHVALQDAMGWLDYHLHLFRVTKPDTGMSTVGLAADTRWYPSNTVRLRAGPASAGRVRPLAGRQ